MKKIKNEIKQDIKEMLVNNFDKKSVNAGIRRAEQWMMIAYGYKGERGYEECLGEVGTIEGLYDFFVDFVNNSEINKEIL